MKIGSVKFFKVLIVTVFILLITVPLVFAIVFGVLFAKERKENNRLQAALAPIGATVDGAPLTDGALIPEIDKEPPSFDYQALYPDLYALPPAETQRSSKTCYLTFDDGPSAVTKEILAILDEADVKATFFITGKASEENSELIQAAVDAGHTIGVHTYSHDYSKIYASVEDYLADFNQMYEKTVEITGVKPTIFRFPGGSINVHNQKVYPQIIAEMIRRGFVFFDWNAQAGDAVIGGVTKQEIETNVMQSAQGRDRVMVLMHDRPDCKTTAEALPDLIEGLRAQGYVFAPLTNQVEPITYFYPD